MKATFRVALLIDTATSWGVGLIKGISRFARQQGNWLLHVEPRGRYERFRLPQGWEGEGVIARVNRAELADEIEASGLPAVNVSWYSFDGPQIVRCSASEDESGRMAADYFLSCGFRNFAYCGPLRRPRYTDLFAEAYAQRLADHGHACLVYPAPKGEQRTIAWNTQLASLAEWLGSLPPATALLCWSAARGRQCTEACQYAGIRVPDDIAVLGGDHDDLMASMSSPPLSTIEHPAEGIGFEAGKALQQLMEAKGVNVPSIMLSPTRVIVRQSTDILAVDDEIVRKALRLMRAQIGEGVNVAQIVSQLMVARRALEQRFMQHLGRTPGEEIRRTRIERAKQLLVETKMTMAEVALDSGFGEQDVFSRTFRRHVGMTPTEFRAVHSSTS